MDFNSHSSFYGTSSVREQNDREGLLIKVLEHGCHLQKLWWCYKSLSEFFIPQGNYILSTQITEIRHTWSFLLRLINHWYLFSHKFNIDPKCRLFIWINNNFFPDEHSKMYVVLYARNMTIIHSSLLTHTSVCSGRTDVMCLDGCAHVWSRGHVWSNVLGPRADELNTSPTRIKVQRHFILFSTSYPIICHIISS